MSTAHEWKVQLLGQPQLVGIEMSKPFPAAGYFLLSQLGFAQNYRLSRSEAASMIWDSPNAMGNLRQLLAKIRAWEPQLKTLLEYDDRHIWLGPSANLIDANHLARCEPPASAFELNNILERCSGELLRDIQAPSANAHELILFQREKLANKFISVVEFGLKHLGRNGSIPHRVLQKAERELLAIDPQREQSFQTLIEVYGAIGSREDADRLFADLAATQRKEHEPGPSRKTQAAYIDASSSRFASLTFAQYAPGIQSKTQLPRVALFAPRTTAEGIPKLVRGIVEDMANTLARYKSFVTLASHSTFKTDHDGGLPENNSILRTDYSVSSFVRSITGEHRTLCVRLVNCKSGSIAWSGEYSLDPEVLITNVRALVTRIARELSTAIEQDSLAELIRTKEPSAFLSFLRAQEAMRTCDLRSVRRARNAYADAVRQDDGFAEAYSGLANTLYLEWLLLGGKDPKLLVESQELADAAILRDRHTSCGYWHRAAAKLYRHDFDGSEADFERAQELHPSSADIMIERADALGHIGDANIAWNLFEQALNLNPSPPDSYWWIGASIAFSKGDFNTSLSLCQKLKNDEPVLRLLTATHGQLGNKAEAREYGLRLKECYPNESAFSMASVQPHRNSQQIQSFMEGLRLAGVK